MAYKKHRPLFAQALPQRKTPHARMKGAARMLWLSFKKTCFALGLMMIISMVFWGITLTRLSEQTAPPVLPSEMVVFLKLDEALPETDNGGGFSNPFEPAPPTLRSVIETLGQAAHDPRVKGLLVRLGDAALPLSQVQELRAAIKAFKASGKFAYIYASSYGGGSGGLGRLYLASAFDQRWMQPLGVVSMEGVQIEVPFFRAALDKLGITPNFLQRKEYKTAYESLTNAQMSAANKRALTTVVEAIHTAISADMPQDLGLDQPVFERYINQGLFTAQEAQKAGLITHLDYADHLIEGVKEQVTGQKDADDSLFVALSSYAQDVGHHGALRKAGQAQAALIYVSGAIVEHNDSARGGVAAADEISTAILDAAEDKKIKAIILRVDSPGGSPVASESILHALKTAQGKGKTVIVSMGSAAASGGYWVASNADRIFALPTTLTGSIGVLGGKIALGKMWDKLDVQWDSSIRWGDNAGLWSMNEPFSPAQKERVDAMLDQIYDAFLQRVSEGRGMNLAEVDKIARGRVWPGAKAKELGLVDEIGGLNDAVAYTAQKLGLPDAQSLTLVQMPRPLSPLEQLAKLLGEQGLVFDALRLQAALGHYVSPVLEEMDAQVISNQSEVLTRMPLILAR